MFSGLRPGEKLYEELLADGDTTVPTSVSGLRLARLQGDSPQGQLLAQLLQCAGPGANSDVAVRSRLQEVVPEYGHG